MAHNVYVYCILCVQEGTASWVTCSIDAIQGAKTTTSTKQVRNYIQLN